MLELKGIAAGYGTAQVLFGVDLTIGAGQAVSLLGRNGMGKTTTVNTIFGLLKARAGSIIFDGEDITGWAPHERARAGLALAPEGRQVFATMTVRENLLAVARPGGWTIRRVHDLFPELAQRADVSAAVLSGGEQQMLAIARALMTNPQLLVLDEATEGLAPKVRQRIWQALRDVRAEGVAMLIIDKNIADLTRFCDRHYMLVKGHIVWEGTSPALMEAEDARRRHLGL